MLATRGGSDRLGRAPIPRPRQGNRLQLVDDHLSSRPYLAGDEFTIGDIPLGSGIWRWMAMPIERRARPNVARWFERLSERPVYRKIVMSPLT